MTELSPEEYKKLTKRVLCHVGQAYSYLRNNLTRCNGITGEPAMIEAALKHLEAAAFMYRKTSGEEFSYSDDMAEHVDSMLYSCGVDQTSIAMRPPGGDW
jgi:hypothetical protein